MEIQRLKELYPSAEVDLLGALDDRVAKYAFFVLERVRTWVDCTLKNPRTLRHSEYGRYTVTSRWPLPCIGHASVTSGYKVPSEVLVFRSTAGEY